MVDYTDWFEDVEPALPSRGKLPGQGVEALLYLVRLDSLFC